jgi:transcription-repair coupling factor (superfamily II helicase)
MYQKILKEAMEELRLSEFPEMAAHTPEKKWKPGTDCQIETDLEILLPADYVESSAERLLLYRELDDMQKEDALVAFREKLIDRFGPMPQPAEDLIETIRLRWAAARLGFEKIILRNDRFSGYFPENQMHPFYQSENFGNVLNYVKNHPRQCLLREKNGKLNLVLNNVKTINEANRSLGRMTQEFELRK